jgi:hypothetical protein
LRGCRPDGAERIIGAEPQERGYEMKTSNRRTGVLVSAWLLAATATVAAVAVPVHAQANQGLVATAGDWLWPQLQARITVQTAVLARVALIGPSEAGVASARGVQGGAVLGDYVFAAPRFGNFRATSGVMLGNPSGAPVLNATPTTRLGITMLDGGYAGNGNSYGSTADGPSTLPYLGLGYSSASFWRSLSVSADVGLVAARPAGLSGLGRAMLGNQAMDAAVRDLRLAPVLQLGVRYSF